MKKSALCKQFFVLTIFIVFCLPVFASDNLKITSESKGNISYGFFSNVKIVVPYYSTPQTVVEEMLKIAEVKKGDVVYDLGCGDGRIVITAAKNYGVEAVGIDLDLDRVKEAKENVRINGVEDLVTIRHEDLFEADISNASVVALYLLPSVNLKLKPILLNQLKPGSRVVSHAFDMGDWEPEKEVAVKHEGAPYMVYLWRIPEKNPMEK